jgi:probable phosphoglycerate mutase
MSSELPRLILVRHGDTDWTDSHQRTGRTDLPLNKRGEARARLLGEYLKPQEFAHIFTSPLQRASRTCELAGHGRSAQIDGNLVEWDYGRFEGMRTKEIQHQNPGWELFRDGCPDGESPQHVAARADRFVARVTELAGSSLAFSSGHIIRMIAARWLGLLPAAGRFFYCRPASIGVLSFEHDRKDEPIIELWNYEVEQGIQAAEGG